ncbi:MAG: hypothetical protein QOH70_678 [Blastocatellia bacterium]|jgi:CHAT domain-containing protein/Tfp pilus assembly protein PilF|nr:hypothetical protein [Blastocatellia bacterium]
MNTAQFKSSFSRKLLSVTFLFSLHGGTFGQSSQTEIKPLTTTPVEYRISGGDKPDRYVIRLKQNEFLQVHAAQKHSDVVLRLLDKKDNELARMNFLYRDDVVETLSFVAPRSDSYMLEVSVFDPKAPQEPNAGYLIHREVARKATLKDRRRVEVEKLFVEAMTERDKEGHLLAAIDIFNETLRGWLELGDRYMADLTAWKIKQTKAVDLFIKARTVAAQENLQEYGVALENFEAAARLFREIDDPFHEYASIIGAAAISQRLGQYEKAIDLSKQALPFFRLLPTILADEPTVLDNIAGMYIQAGKTYLQTGNKQAAIERFALALQIYAGLKKEASAAATENDIGALYVQMGQNDDALVYLNRALERREQLPDKCALRDTLTNIGVAFDAKGEKTKALSSLNRALSEGKEGNTCAKGRAHALTNIGKVYNELGANELALTYLCASVKLPETIATPELAAATHNNLGIAYYAQGEYERALTSYQTALTLFQLLGDHKNEATILSNIGVVHSVEGRNDAALGQFTKSLEIRRQLGDANGEAITLNNIGEVYAAKGNSSAARANFDLALPLFRATEDRNGEAVTLGNEMVAWNSLGNRPTAIFYGKRAVNRLQELRGAARGLDNEIQKNYLRTVKRSYQLLAELLIAEGLFEQAVQVLTLYQDETFFDFDFDPNSQTQQTDFSLRERDFAARYEAASVSLAQIGSSVRELRRQVSFRPPKTGETDELQKLQEQFKAAMEIFSTVLKDGEQELAKPAGDEDRTRPVKGIADFRDALGKLGERKQRTVAIFTLAGSDRLNILLVKPHGVEAYAHAVGPEDLTRETYNLFSVLTDRRIMGADLIAPSAALYDLIFKSTSTRDKTRTLAAELANYKPDVLLWSLEGSLRHVPMAALYDTATRQYLVEKYQNVVFTRTEKQRLLRESADWNGGIAFGKSNLPKTPCGPPALRRDTGDSCELLKEPKGVKEEPLVALPAVRRDLPEIARILQGPMFLDDEFTLQSFLGNIQGKNHPLIHISSHFCFQSGDAKNSFLLLGDDSKLSLSEMKAYRNLFDGVDLLVLSACQTALQSEGDSLREIDSLAELCQRLKARSVIATLWNADAAGAGKLMIQIYKLHQLKRGLSKAELLRQAQLSFLKNRIRVPENIDHPYYWAPFVLYGNFQ